MPDVPITPPIFVVSSDVEVFSSKEDAESYLEPVGVPPDERGYDAEGRLLRVLVRGEVRRGRWSIDQSRARVELVLAEEEPTHRDELRTHLAEWLRGARDATLALDSATLEQLVERAARIGMHGPTGPQVSRMDASLFVALAVVLGALWWLSR